MPRRAKNDDKRCTHRVDLMLDDEIYTMLINTCEYEKKTKTKCITNAIAWYYIQRGYNDSKRVL